MISLRELFPAEDFRFRMTMRRSDPALFFQDQDDGGRLLQQRNYWLDQDSALYAGLMPEGRPLLVELKELAKNWGLDTMGEIIHLARHWEPDFLLLAPDQTGRFRLIGGALCFPTGWALAEKLGHTLDFIHGVVPGLNDTIGPAIDQFLHGLKPGLAFQRSNWGIAATDELNLHPARGIKSPQPPVRLDGLWLRVEEQLLLALPRNHGVLFGIRIVLHRLDEVRRDAEIAAGLCRALRSMTSELAIYKGLARVREPLADMLIDRV